jgi:hypothetical protein
MQVDGILKQSDVNTKKVCHTYRHSGSVHLTNQGCDWGAGLTGVRLKVGLSLWEITVPPD